MPRISRAGGFAVAASWVMATSLSLRRAVYGERAGQRWRGPLADVTRARLRGPGAALVGAGLEGSCLHRGDGCVQLALDVAREGDCGVVERRVADAVIGGVELGDAA